MKNEILWNTDIFADIISSNEKIISLCEEVKGALPGFSCLSECGLFTEGLSSIESMTSSLEDSVNGLSQMVKQHNESIASRESKIESLYRDTPFISLGNVKNFKDYAMGSVPFLVAGAVSKYSNVEPTFETTSHETPSSSKSTSTIMTYEEYKKGAQKFAQEHGLPEMSDSDMKESYTSYITKQPIIPKTEMKSMPEREVSTPIQEQNTKNNDLSQDRYYRMKAEQTKEQPFSSEAFKKNQTEREQISSMSSDDKLEAESNADNNLQLLKDRYYRMKAEQTKDSNFSQSRYEEIKNSENIEPTETPSSSKSTSTIMTYEEYKKGAQKFAQEHGLPEMSDSDMKESYTSYITKQPIIPKTEMKSMPEREVSTPIQEQNTKNNDLSQDRYYRMKAEQTKEQPFSSEAFKKNQTEREQISSMSSDTKLEDNSSVDNDNNSQLLKDRYYRMKAEQTKEQPFSSEAFKKNQTEREQISSMSSDTKLEDNSSVDNDNNSQLLKDRYYRMKAEQTRDSRFSSETFDKAQLDRNHLSDESTRDTGLADNTNNNVKPSIPEDKYTNNNNSYNNNQDFSSTKNSSDLFNDSENPSKPNDNIDKNYSNEFDYSKDLNQPTKSYEESQTTIEQVKNNSYQPNDIFVNRNQNNYSTKTTEDIINDISSKDDSIISNTQNNNVIKENNNNYDFKNDNNLNAEVQEQYHENNKNDDWLNGIAGVGVAGLGAFGLNNLLKNKHKKSENDTEDDDE